MTKEQMDAAREKARAAAGYVHPGTLKGKAPGAAPPPPPRPIPPPNLPPTTFDPRSHPPYVNRPGTAAHVPLKKLGVPAGAARSPAPAPDRVRSLHAPGGAPPSTASRLPAAPAPPPPAYRATKSGAQQSQQKWDDMFDCLVNFIEEVRERNTSHMTEERKREWIWDGNVPTSYKSPCGKALGRWINNQRSAKAKVALSDPRTRTRSDKLGNLQCLTGSLRGPGTGTWGSCPASGPTA